MQNLNWHPRWAAMLNLTASWSEDTSSKYSALIVDGRNVLISMGYNGLPRGIRLHPSYHNRPDKYDYFVHAETNAIIQASGRDIQGCTIYLIEPPCARCAGEIIQAGIKDIRYIREHDTTDPRWTEESTGWRAGIETANSILYEAGVYMEQMKLEEQS